LEISGVNRLLALAQELGVRETKQVSTPHRVGRDASDSLVSRDSKAESESGLKVTLSAAASRLSEGAIQAVSLDPASTISSPQEDEFRARAIRSQRGRGIAAYEQNARAISGEHIKVIA